MNGEGLFDHSSISPSLKLFFLRTVVEPTTVSTIKKVILLVDVPDSPSGSCISWRVIGGGGELEQDGEVKRSPKV